MSLQQEEASCHFKHSSAPAELIPLHKNPDKVILNGASSC